jgi:hypothetical protein
MWKKLRRSLAHEESDSLRQCLLTSRTDLVMPYMDHIEHQSRELNGRHSKTEGNESSAGDSPIKMRRFGCRSKTDKRSRSYWIFRRSLT